MLAIQHQQQTWFILFYDYDDHGKERHVQTARDNIEILSSMSEPVATPQQNDINITNALTIGTAKHYLLTMLTRKKKNIIDNSVSCVAATTNYSILPLPLPIATVSVQRK
jgi:hypothetical protein